MSHPKSDEDPFYSSIRALKALLQEKKESTGTVGRQVQIPTPPRNIFAEGTTDVPNSLTVNEECSDVLRQLQSKLLFAEATAEKERLRRLSIEHERDEVLLECQESRKLFGSPLQGDRTFLKREVHRHLSSRLEERKTHQIEMDNVLLQLQSAKSQRDSMEAKLISSQRIIEDLKHELAIIHIKLEKYELEAKTRHQPTKRTELQDGDEYYHSKSNSVSSDIIQA